MKVYVLSDLHLEFADFQPPQLNDDVDLVVLSGDIHKLDKGVKWANETFSQDVLYVLGNHEFYNGHFDRTLHKARHAAAGHVHLLENDSFIAGDTRFLGTTAWTDFSASGNVSAAMSIARASMNDFRLIRAGSDFRRLRPDDVATRNRQAKKWLEDELAKPFGGKTVVITHHAPLIEIGGSEHADHLTASYYNAWHGLVDKVDGWIFGHTHSSHDVMFGGCRLVSNQRGYPGEECGFDPHKVVEF